VDLDPVTRCKAADSCSKKAKTTSNSREWTRYAETWDEIAKLAVALTGAVVPHGQRHIA
jgi:hypothetical protein